MSCLHQHRPKYIYLAFYEVGTQSKSLIYNPSPMVHSVNPNLDQRMNHMHFYNKIVFGKKKIWDVDALTLQWSPISSFYIFQSRFALWFSSFSFDFFPLFFLLFYSLQKHSHIMDEKKYIYIDCDGYVLGFLFDSISVEHSSLGFRVWNGKVCIAYSHVWFHVEEKTLFGLLKGNMDSQIIFFLILIQKTCSSKGLGFFMVHFDTFVKNWVHIWEYNIQLWKIQFWWKIGLQCLWCG